MSPPVTSRLRAEGFYALDDAALGLARVMLLIGFAAVSLLVVRVGTITAGDVLILSAAAIIITTRPSGWLPKARSVRFADVALISTVLGGGLATIVSPSPAQSFLVLVRLTILAVVLPWEIRLLLTTGRRLLWAYAATGLGAALNGMATVSQLAFHTEIPGTQATDADRYSGLTANVSDTGAICGLGIVIGFGLLGRGRWRKSDLGAGSILVFSLVGVILSGSVSGMLAAAAGALVIVALRGVARRKVMIAVVTGSAAVAAGFYLISRTTSGLSPVERFLQVLGLKSLYAGTNTSASRIMTIRAGWASFAQHPLTGIGLDINSSIVYQDLTVHNLPVALLHVGGIFFAFGIIGLLCSLMVGAIALRRRAPLSPLALGAVASAWVFALTAPGYYNRYFWVPIALCAAVPLVTHRHLKTPANWSTASAQHSSTD